MKQGREIRSLWKRRWSGFVLALPLGLGIGAPAAAAPILVDFGISDASPGPGNSVNQVQSGYFDYSFAQTGTNSTTGDATAVSATSRTIGIYTVGVSDGIGGRDRMAEMTGPLADLLEEFIFASGSGSTAALTVTIGGLTPGQAYKLTTYHHDSHVDQPSTTWTVNGVAFGTVNPVSGTDSSLAQFLQGEFTPSGTTLTLVGTPSATNAVINGFILEAVPEPSSALVCGLAGLAMLSRRRREQA